MDAILKSDLLERLKTNGLLFEELSLSGREIIVHETTGHSSRKIGMLAMEIEDDPEIPNSSKDALFTLYIPLIACSEGDVPKTPDEFFWMKDADIEEWTRVARKINPRIFAVLDAQEKRLEAFLSMSEDALEKKKEKPIT